MRTLNESSIKVQESLNMNESKGKWKPDDLKINYEHSKSNLFWPMNK